MGGTPNCYSKGLSREQRAIRHLVWAAEIAHRWLQQGDAADCSGIPISRAAALAVLDRALTDYAKVNERRPTT